MYTRNVENVGKKGFGGKLSIVLVQKKKYFKIHARWVLSKVLANNAKSTSRSPSPIKVYMTSFFLSFPSHADQVAYARKDLKADFVLDMATLTGAQGIATGRYHASIVTNKEDWEQACVLAGRASGDLVVSSVHVHVYVFFFLFFFFTVLYT